MLCVNSSFNMFSCFQHILFAHGPWFLKRWGPLSIWNTQGMEKSHYRARAVYFRNTRHGGGFTRSNALQEMFDWLYRTIIGRTLNIRKARESIGTCLSNSGGVQDQKIMCLEGIYRDYSSFTMVAK